MTNPTLQTAKRRHLATAVVAGAGILVTLILYQHCTELESKRSAYAFDRHTATVTGTIEKAARKCEDLVHAASASARPYADTKFGAYSAGITREFPPFRYLIWATRVDDAERFFFEFEHSGVEKSGFEISVYDDRRIRHAAETSDLYFPILQSAPDSAATLPIGLDLLSLPWLKKRITAAGDSDRLVADLSRDLKPTSLSGPAFVLVNPVYAENAVKPTPFSGSAADTDKTSGFTGVVVGIVDPVRLVDYALIGIESAKFVDFKLVSGDSSAGDTIYESAPASQHDGAWTSEHTIDVAGEHMQVYYRPSRHFQENHRPTLTRNVLYGGLMLSAVLTLYLWQLVGHINQIERLADELRATNESLVCTQRNLQANQQQLVAAERTNAVQKMALGVTRDVRQPLTTIYLTLEMLQRSYGKNDGTDKVQSLMRQALEQLGELMQRLMELTDRDSHAGTGDENIAESHAPPAETPSNTRYILVIEDEAPLRDALSLMLDTLGVKVDTAGDGDEALPLIEANTYDLVLSDINLPGSLNGIDIAVTARNTKPNLRFVFMSAANIEESWHSVIMNSGGLLAKPFDVADLQRVLSISDSAHDESTI